jgi:hypothetical protein
MADQAVSSEGTAPQLTLSTAKRGILRSVPVAAPELLREEMPSCLVFQRNPMISAMEINDLKAS